MVPLSVALTGGDVVAAAGAPYALQGCGHAYCYYCLAEQCPALLMPVEDLPADKTRQRSFRCRVCVQVAQKAVRFVDYVEAD